MSGIFISCRFRRIVISFWTITDYLSYGRRVRGGRVSIKFVLESYTTIERIFLGLYTFYSFFFQNINNVGILHVNFMHYNQYDHNKYKKFLFLRYVVHEKKVNKNKNHMVFSLTCTVRFRNLDDFNKCE